MLKTATPRPCVALLNTSVETIEILQSILEEEGFSVASGYIVDFKRGKRDLATFFSMHKPKALVYDIAIPYEDNWTYLQEQVLQVCGLVHTSVVITTTNRQILERMVGPINVIEVIGKPFDLEEVVQTVRFAVERTHSQEESTSL